MPGLKIKSVKSLGKKPVYNISMKSEPHNYLIYDKNKDKSIVSKNSHSVSYTYLSSRMLWLKCHYPLEFYTAVLSCETQEDKIKEYKSDADRHGVQLRRVDLNKSKETFSIVDESIYYGFSNIKGIGEEISKRLVVNQPYTSIVDFFDRFGTDASVIKPLVALNAFENLCEDKIHLYKFYNHYKDWKKKKNDRDKRYDKSLISQDEKLISLLPNHPELAKFEEECYKAWEMFDKEEITTYEEEVIDTKFLKTKYDIKDSKTLLSRLDEIEALEGGVLPKITKTRTKKYNLYNELMKVKKKREKSLEDLDYKISREHIGVPNMNSFNPNPDDYHIDSDYQQLLLDKEAAEKQYYGFIWQHPLEKSPDYHIGLTIENLIVEAETEGLKNGPIEIIIKSCKKMLSKKDTIYYTCEVEDANSVTKKVIFWEEDYERFKEYLIPGNFLRLRVFPPSGGFPSLTFYSPPKRDRHKLVPKDVKDDTRLIVMRKPKIEGYTPTLDEFQIKED